MCKIKMRLYVCVCVVCVCDILAMGSSGCVGLRYSMRLSTAVFFFLKLFIQ